LGPLFIFESIGTSELILIGIVALIFLGPRKLPELAKKAGKIMSEFRGTANEFKDTWQREVNFEDEAKLLNIKDLDAEEESVPRVIPPSSVEHEAPSAPAIKEIDPERVKELFGDTTKTQPETGSKTENDKKNWL
jgi:Tat protein translocase TatB subunit